jgi:hypothetical protein
MKFPLSSAKALPRQPSDHTPILRESGVGQKIDKPRFKFEKWWLKYKDFEKLVKGVWSAPIRGEKVIDRWQNEIKLLRRKAKGWSANVVAESKRRKIS